MIGADSHHVELVTIIYGVNFVSVIVPYLYYKILEGESRKLFYELKHQEVVEQIVSAFH